jgi:predicted nucleotide-binding protein (sugar kinase/HSP70/actin superfamily)
MMRIGIPRALLYYEYFPMWKTFFEELGAEVVVSSPTTSEMFNSGCSRVIADICLPVKVFCGHVLSLVDRCDYVFIPSICSVEHKVYSCPKFIGLPDLVRATVPECPPILDPDIDVTKGQRELYQAIYKLGRPFTRSPLKVKKAAERALQVHRAYRAQMARQGLTAPQAIAKMFPQSEPETEHDGFAPDMTIALVGHPYLLYDEYVNHRLMLRLQRMGAKILFPEMVAEEELRKAICQLVERPYWSYEEEVIGAGGYYLQSDVDGIISVAAFGCGPDSLMAEFLQRHARRMNKPFLNLVLDQHTAEAGLVTRLEAFVDMTKRRGNTQVKSFYLGKLEEEEQEGLRSLGIPNMANIAPAFRASAEILNVSLIAPPVTQRTISLGTRYSPEFVCLPFKGILGTFIESLEQGAETLFMVTSFNACRMGYYAKVQEQILRDLGYKFNFLKYRSSDKGVIGVLRAIKRFTNNAPWSKVIAAYRLGTAKLKALDDLERKVEKTRAVELEKGSTERIFHEAIQAIDAVADLTSLKRVVKEYFGKLDQMPKNPEIVPLKVGIIGELYVVMEPFTNINLEVELGKLGVEVRRTRTTFFSEWTNLGSYLNVLDSEKKKLQKFARPYLRRDVGGHGLESVGEKIRLAPEYDGLVHLAPFTCMPEAIAQNIMLTTKEDIPVLTILCDEQLGKAGLLTRVEAFVDLLEWRRRKKTPKKEIRG